MPITDGSKGFMLVTSIAFAATGEANIVIVVSEGEYLVSFKKIIEESHSSTAVQIFLFLASNIDRKIFLASDVEKSKDLFDDMRKKISEPGVLLLLRRKPNIPPASMLPLWSNFTDFEINVGGKPCLVNEFLRPKTAEDEKKEKIILNVSSTCTSSCSELWVEQIEQGCGRAFAGNIREVAERGVRIQSFRPGAVFTDQYTRVCFAEMMIEGDDGSFCMPFLVTSYYHLSC